jgi:hypothetical protein
MGLWTQFTNKIQYLSSQFLNDPDADAYAKQQADQKAQDAEAQQRLDDIKTKTEEDAKAKAIEDAKSADIVDRTKFIPSRVAGKIASGVLNGFLKFFLICIMLYGGHLAANDMIGYKYPFRVVSFFYGSLVFYFFIIKMIYQKYWLKKELHSYAFLPLSTYVPSGNLEKIFLGPFCYTEDDYSMSAAAAVKELYSKAFEKSQIKDS